MIRLFQFQGIPVFAHWSVLAIASFILVANWRDLLLAAAAVGSYLGVIAVHELGHAVVARRLRCHVLWIKLYPIHGVCFHEDAGRRRNAVIAWGGVLAQGVVAFPLLVFLAVFGYTPFPAANAAIVILGVFSTGWALFNLLPIAPLDGSRAWSALAGFRLRSLVGPRPRKSKRRLRAVR